MLLYHDGKIGSFTQYRTHLNGKFVFPWWQSAIPSYQEEANALYYQPDGWEMALGTVDVRPGADYGIRDCFVFFDGNWHTFLQDVYPRDPEVDAVLGAFKPGPEWLRDVKVQISTNNTVDLERLVQLFDEGEILYLFDPVASWADYRVANGSEGVSGGRVSGGELREHMANLRKLSPRLKIGMYNWINSVSVMSPIFAEHPEYFLLKTRSGAIKNLFPGGFMLNHPTMINRPAAAEFMLNNFRHLIDYLNVDYIYLDETKTVNLIDWQNDDLMRDDHWNDFWMAMYRLGQERGVVMFGNGRGNPYQELNFIEAIHQLAPERWREFCGMAMAVANFVNNRKGARVDLLYWNPKMDYITRVLANGFIPTINFLRYQQIPYVTAAAELGQSTIYDLKYTPDWKKDPHTELESYCIRRDRGGEWVFSVINRSRRDSVRAEVDTATLGSDLTVWCYRIARYPDDAKRTYGFGERERRANYRATGWREGVIAAPELVYSGKNPGKLVLELRQFPTGEFAQFVISDTIGGVYSVDGMPKNYFLAATPKVQVSGAQFPVTVRSEAEHAEILLTTAPGSYRINGKTVMAQAVPFGKRMFALLPVGKGESRIEFIRPASYPAAPFTAKVRGRQLEITGKPGVVTIHRDGLLLYSGTAPALPEFHDAGELVLNTLDGRHPVRVSIPTGKPSAAMQVAAPPLHPAVLKVEPLTGVMLDDAKISAAATSTSRWNSPSGIQRDQAPLMATVDVEKRTVCAGTSDKIVDNLGHAAAGLLLEGADKLELEFASTFADAGGKMREHVYRYRRHGTEFAGIMLDFQRDDGKFERVALATGVLNHQRSVPGAHGYGSGKTADRVYELGHWLGEKKPRRITLNLKALAPADWNGKVFVSAAASWVNPGRRITLRLLHANAKAAAPPVTPISRAAFAAEFNAPRRGTVPTLRGAAAFDTVMAQGWLMPQFYRLGGTGFPEHQTRAAVACDAENLYVAFDTLEADTIGNEVEIWVRGPSGGLWQFICEPDGGYQVYRDGFSVGDRRFRLTRSGQGRYLAAIPFTMTGRPDAQAWLFNVARHRDATREAPEELSSYAPLQRSFKETGKFAVLHFGASSSPSPSPTVATPRPVPAATAEHVRVVNLGRGGYSTANILAVTLPEALKLRPAVTVLLAGTNDMLNPGKMVSMEQFEKNLAAIIGALRKRGSAVVLNTLPPCSESLLLKRHDRKRFGTLMPAQRIAAANAVIRRLAADNGCVLWDLHAMVAASGAPDDAASLLRNPANSKREDGVHLRPAGYAQWASALRSLPVFAALPPDSVVVCLGDSLTYGAGMRGAGTVSGDTMPGYLQKLLVP